MSTKRKQKVDDDGDSKGVLDSFKKIFRGNPKMNKLNRVVSHKLAGSVQTNNSLKRRPRSRSEPDLFAESLVLDSRDVKLEAFLAQPFPENKLLLSAESSLRSRSFDNFNEQLAKTCPSKAAKTLGLGDDTDSTVLKVKHQKEKKDQSPVSFKKKSELGNRGSKRFSIKSKDKEGKENRVIEFDAVEMPSNVSTKAAKTLGIQPVGVPSKAAKTLGISSDNPSNSLSTEDFLRKIGAFASERGGKMPAVSRKSGLRKQATSPMLRSGKPDQMSTVPDTSTNALLRKLVQLSPNADRNRGSSNNAKPAPLTKTQSEVGLSVSRKRRIETPPEEKPPTTTSPGAVQLTLTANFATTSEIRPEVRTNRVDDKASSEKRTLPRPHSLIVAGRDASSSTAVARHQLTCKPAPLENHRVHAPTHSVGEGSVRKLTSTSQTSSTQLAESPRQLPALKTLQINQKKLLKKCESDSRITIPRQ